MQTGSNSPVLITAAERVARAVADVSRGAIEGEWSIREGCRRKNVHPQTYYKHLKRQREGGGEPIAAADAPCETPGASPTQTHQDSTNEEAA